MSDDRSKLDPRGYRMVDLSGPRPLARPCNVCRRAEQSEAHARLHDPLEPGNQLSYVFMPIRVPPMLVEAIGYTGEARFVGLYWIPGGDEVMYDDGQQSGTGDWGPYLMFTRDVLVYPALTSRNYNFGSSEEEAEHWLVVDREDGHLYAGRWRAASRFLMNACPDAKRLTDEELQVLVHAEVERQAYLVDHLEEEVDKRMREAGRKLEALRAWLDEKAAGLGWYLDLLRGEAGGRPPTPALEVALRTVTPRQLRNMQKAAAWLDKFPLATHLLFMAVDLKSEPKLEAALLALAKLMGGRANLARAFYYAAGRMLDLGHTHLLPEQVRNIYEQRHRTATLEGLDPFLVDVLAGWLWQVSQLPEAEAVPRRQLIQKLMIEEDDPLAETPLAEVPNA